MAQIEALTRAQLSRIPELVERWQGIGLSTAPTDRRAAEDAIRRCYERAGIKLPEQFIWLRSPLAGALAYTLLRHSNASVRDSVQRNIVPDGHNRIDLFVSIIATTNLPDRILASIWASVRDSVWANVESMFIASDSVRDVIYGSLDAGGLSVDGHFVYSFFFEVCEFKEYEGFDGLLEQAKHCGWWWPFENLVIATEKPVALHLDERGRLHHATEPAIAYGDGWGVYAWHGTRVPSNYYEQPVTVQHILNETNAAVRRALIERYGQKRFFLDADATVLDRDPQHGAELIAIDLPDDPERRMVALKLHCPSTAAVYIVRVPPKQTKARAALAWSFGLQDASEYVLAGES